MLLWLIVLSLLRGAAYLLITPPWQAPDETTHFQFMELLTQRPLAEIRKIDVMILNDQKYLELEGRILQSMKKYKAWEYVGMPVPDPFPPFFYKAPFFSGSAPKIYRPPLYYLLGAAVLKLFNPKELETRFYIARVYSFILSLGTIIVSCLIGYLLFKDETYALMTGTFVSFLPQFMVIGTSVNSDNLFNFLASLFLLYGVFLLSERKSDLYLIPIPLLLPLLFLSGKASVVIAPISIFLFAFHIRRSKKFLLILALSLLILVSLAIFVHYLLPGMTSAAQSTLKWVWGSISSGIERGSDFYEFFSVVLFKSFWFVGGWMQIYWNTWFYIGSAIVCFFSSLGLLIILWDRIMKKGEISSPTNPVLLLLMFAALLAFGATFLFYGFVQGVLAQGRYLFSALPAFAVLFIFGLKRVCPRWIDPYFPRVFILFMALLDVYALFGSLLPYYHFR